MRAGTIADRAVDGGGLTTWRSAANAPDGVQNALMMVGAFGSCNGLLGGMVWKPDRRSTKRSANEIAPGEPDCEKGHEEDCEARV
jgi:hypothetical protein